MTNSKLQFKKLAFEAAKLADSKKAEEITVYDMEGRSELADYVVVAAVDSPAQLEAVEDEIVIKLKQDGIYALHKDGMQSKNWKVLDYGGVLVHIFDKQARLFYSFDKVYGEYKQLKWNAAEKERRPAPAKRSEKRPRKPAAKAKKKSSKK